MNGDSENNNSNNDIAIFFNPSFKKNINDQQEDLIIWH